MINGYPFQFSIHLMKVIIFNISTSQFTKKFLIFRQNEIEAETKIWILTLIDEMILAMDPGERRKYLKNKITTLFAGFAELITDVNMFLKQETMSSKVQEKFKKIPKKMQKNYVMLEEKIIQVEKEIDLLNELTWENLETKYGRVNQEIATAVDQLKEFLEFHGIELMKGSENNVTKVCPDSPVYQENLTIIRKRKKINFNMADLNHEEEDEDFKIGIEPVVTPNCSRPKRHCSNNVVYLDD